MADKTEFLQAIDDAILDADSLERFVNGSEDETVLTRLSAEYPTLKNAIKTVFKNGGLPTNRFKTFAELQASSLLEGDYALVVGDTGDKNGIYVKEIGEWVQSKYNPLNVDEVKDVVADALDRNDKNVDIDRIVGRSINVGLNASEKKYNESVFSGSREHVKIDVSDTRMMTVKNSEGVAIWQWVFRDGQDNLISITKGGINGFFEVPNGAKWAYRTVKVDDISDDNIEVILTKKDSPYLGGFALADGVEPLKIYPGYSANAIKEIDRVFQRTTVTNEFAYLKIDVGNTDALITDGLEAKSDWVWVFRDEDNKWIDASHEAGDGYYTVPDGAKWAYKTYAMVNEIPESDRGSVKIRKIKKVSDLQPSLLNKVSDVVRGYVDELTPVNLPMQSITGYTVNAAMLDLPILSPSNNDVRESVRVDVIDRNLSYIKVSNSGDVHNSWNLLFVDEYNKRLGIAPNSDGIYKMPDGTTYIYKTVYYKNSSGETDGRGVQFEGYYSINTLQSQIDEISTSLKDGAIAESKLEQMLERNDFISPNDFEGATQTERLKNAVDFVRTSGIGIVEIAHDDIDNSDVWVVDEAITLPSNCWIYINNVTVKKAPKLFDNVFRNDGIVPNPDPFGFALELNENRNIRIFGNDKALSKISGNMDDPHVGVNPVTGATEPFMTDIYGWKCFSILFANTINYHVYNLSFDNVTGWTISNEHGCEGFSYHDLIFDNRGKNSDGVNIRMGCSNFEIYNIEGTTKDDMVACTTLNNWISSYPHTTPLKGYVYPLQVGGFSDRGHGVDIKNGVINNVIGDASNEALLILATGGSKVHNISVSNIKDRNGGFSVAGVRILGTGYGASPQLGDIANITINNVITTKTPVPVKITSPLKNVWINKVHKGYGDSSTPPVYISGSFDFDNVKITNTKQTS